MHLKVGIYLSLEPRPCFVFLVMRPVAAPGEHGAFAPTPKVLLSPIGELPPTRFVFACHQNSAPSLRSYEIAVKLQEVTYQKKKKKSQPARRLHNPPLKLNE